MEEGKDGRRSAKGRHKAYLTTQKQLMGCFRCKSKTCSYMVSKEVWLNAWPSYEVDKRANPTIFMELCLSCLQELLHRRLTIDDFTCSPVNIGIRFGFELGLDYVLQRISK